MQQRHVLIVDDNDDFRDLIRAMISRLGYEPQTAASAEVALTHLLNGLPCDLILSDLNMSGASGIELRVKLLSLGRDIPMILMSAKQEFAKQEIKSLGIASLLRKPFSNADLIKALNTALDRTLMIGA